MVFKNVTAFGGFHKVLKNRNGGDLNYFVIINGCGPQ